MVKEQIEVTVRVTKVGINLVKVTFTDGYQLVCGGRLVSSTEDGVTTPHPDLPEYTKDRFPCDFDRWMQAQADASVVGMEAVSVAVRRCHRCADGQDRVEFVRIGSPRVPAYLFSVKPKDEVVAWIRREASK